MTVQATIIGLGANGACVSKGENRQIIHLGPSPRRKRPLGIGDVVLCEGIVRCEGDAYASGYRLLKRHDTSEVFPELRR